MAELSVPQINFGSLGDLPQVYRDARIQAVRDRTLAELGQGGNWDIEAGAKKLAQAGDIQGAMSLATMGKNLHEGNSVFGTPIYGNIPDGKGGTTTGIGTFDKNGKFRPIDTGPFQPTPGIKTVDTGTGTVVISGKSGAPVGGYQNGAVIPGPAAAPQHVSQQPGYIPKDVAGAEREKKYGQEIGDRQADLGKARASLDSSFSSMDRMADVAKSIINDQALSGITGWQGALPNFPGGRAANVQARLDNLTSQAGFAVLQAMRDASKTGGALGQVSDFENRQLQNNIAALQRTQDPKQFRQELQKLIAWTEGVKGRLSAAYEQDYANIPKPNPSAQPTTQTSPAGPQQPVTKTIGGKTYIQSGGNWFEQ